MVQDPTVVASEQRLTPRAQSGCHNWVKQNLREPGNTIRRANRTPERFPSRKYGSRIDASTNEAEGGAAGGAVGRGVAVDTHLTDVIAGPVAADDAIRRRSERERAVAGVPVLVICAARGRTLLRSLCPSRRTR